MPSDDFWPRFVALALKLPHEVQFEIVERLRPLNPSGAGAAALDEIEAAALVGLAKK